MILFKTKKFNTLFKTRQPKHNQDEVIFNYSKVSLSYTEKSLLVRELWFPLPPKKLNYADYLTNFVEVLFIINININFITLISILFYRIIRNLDVLSNGDLDFFKTKIKDAALSSFRFYNANVPQNLSEEELEALDRLSKNKNLVVQKADKGNSVVLVVYVKHMENVLKDNTKFEKVEKKLGL